MKKILVIDDEEQLREMVHMALTTKGYDVLVAQDGRQGTDLAKKVLPDLVLCDVNMANLDGYRTLAELRADPAMVTTPFILMTGLADNAGMRHGMELGADDYLAKPFSLDVLYAAVEARLRKVQVVRKEAEKKLSDLRDNISLMLPHELRTPLNGILNLGEILTSQAATLSAGEVAEFGRDICESGRRLERLIENCLIYAQLELIGSDPQKMAALQHKLTLSPAELVEERARAQAKAARRPLDLDLDLTDVPLPIQDHYLARIVDELVQNAFKFSAKGSRVTITLAETPTGASLTVTDRGRGFSTEFITKVGAYMQFDRKLQEQQGLGLGLTIARRLAELHGGTLQIESERGVHTTVTAKLPQAVFAPTAATTSSAAAPVG
jgi:two-component system, sensor histidine kinase and response regulator